MKVYVYVEQYFEDIVAIRVYKDKQKAMDCELKLTIDRMKKDRYFTEESLQRNVDTLIEAYNQGNFEYLGIEEKEIIE